MAQPATQQPAALFICLGNICRSPLAEGLCLHHLSAIGRAGHAHADSAGTAGYHIGKSPDHRSIAVATQHGVTLPSKARQVDPAQDWHRFTLLIPMDRDNESDILDLGAPASKVRRLGSFLHRAHERFDADVPDPYYDNDDAFAHVFTMLDDAMPELVRTLLDA